MSCLLSFYTSPLIVSIHRDLVVMLSFLLLHPSFELTPSARLWYLVYHTAGGRSYLGDSRLYRPHVLLGEYIGLAAWVTFRGRRLLSRRTVLPTLFSFLSFSLSVVSRLPSPDGLFHCPLSPSPPLRCENFVLRSLVSPSITFMHTSSGFSDKDTDEHGHHDHDKMRWLPSSLFSDGYHGDHLSLTSHSTRAYPFTCIGSAPSTISKVKSIPTPLIILSPFPLLHLGHGLYVL